ncbi:MAG: NUDIX domain-containing protein [Nostocales cyanobacterium]|nr:MAG: NUDIX domain-containing protein [Nostocales cyanobacterium]
MRKKSNKIYKQSGVIPYRVTDGKIEVLLITTRKSQKWVIPKGGVCKGMTPHDSAAKEAWEEAGVVGRVNTKKIGAYKYRKRGNLYRVNLFWLPVERVLEDWPEAAERERKWLDINHAAMIVKENSLKRILASSQEQVKAEINN